MFKKKSQEQVGYERIAKSDWLRLDAALATFPAATLYYTEELNFCVLKGTTHAGF
jgi:hypothetical protein